MGTVLRARRSLRNIPGASSLRSWQSMLQTPSYHLNTALEKFGSSPPDVTQSGTPTRLLDLRVEVNDITAGAARGQAKFRWSEDGGSNWTSGVTTAATTLLGTTGITLAWAVGTYATNNVYIGKVVQWDDLSGRENHYENALSVSGANQPKVSLAGLNGRPALYFEKAATNYLRRASSTYCMELCGGEDTPLTVFTVGQIVSDAAAQHAFWSITNTTVTTGEVTFLTATSNWACSKRGDIGGELVSKAGTEDLSPHIFEFIQHGTTVSLLVDGTSVISSSAQNANIVTVSEAFIGAVRSGANIYGDVLIGEHAVYVGALDADTRGFIRQYLENRWGF